MSPLSPWRFSILGYQAGFGAPAFLGLVAVAAVCALLAVVVAARRSDRAAALVSRRLLGLLTPGVSLWRPIAQASAQGAALGLFALALAQPQCGSRTEQTKRRGIDVVVALDASKSMLARDVAPSRLERAKLELTTLLDELKGDRVGVVAFAGDAFIQAPLTSDYNAAKLFLRAVDPDQMPQGGTNIGAALALSFQVLERADRGAKERVVVLLSDGEDLAGEIDSAVGQLREAGVRVLAVGVGSERGEPIPILSKRGEVVGYKKDSAGNTVMTRLQTGGLREIATATGGELYYEPKGVAMSQVVGVIDRMQKSELESRLTVQYAEMFQYPLALGLLMLALGMLIRPSARRRS